MSNGPRELKPSELHRVAETLARVAPDGAVDAPTVRMELDFPGERFAPGGTPLGDWLATVKAANAGISSTAGFRADAVARVVERVADRLPGNPELSRLFFDLGSAGAQAAAGERGIFLSYASANRDQVDALYDALAAAAPGLALFLDHRSIGPGQRWLDVIRDAAGSASVLACWVTPDFLQRTFCAYEIGVADSRGAAIVPIWVDGLDPNSAASYLSSRQGRMSAAPHDFADLAAWLVAGV
jgi:hypothetical protein